MKAAHLLAVCLAVVQAPLTLACVHAGNEESQLAEMEADVNRIRADRERAEDSFLHEDQEKELAKVGPTKGAPVTSPVSNARSLQLGEEASGPVPTASEAAVLDGDDPNDTTPRPAIRVEGTPFTRRGVRGQERVEETLPDDAPNGGAVGPAIRANAPTPSALDVEARRSYDAALALVNAKQFDKALDAFAGFLVKWPDHPNADNAMYWRGECYFAKGEYARAAEEFEGTMARFPLGNKVPDAMLKLGICQQKLGNGAKAKTYFDRLLRDFPRSEAARRIPGEQGESSGRRVPGPEENR